jgi:putative transcriptional regulator
LERLSVPEGIRSLLRSLAVACLLAGLISGGASAQIGSASMLLVASNQLQDPRFARSVILVTRHGRSPPLGVIINRPLDATLGNLFPKLPPAEAKRPLFFGGPVGTDSLVFLYRDESGSPDAIAIAGNIFLGRSGVTLGELLRGKRTHSGLRVFAGYSGWGEGQLEEEIRRGDWYVMPVDSGIVFDQEVGRLWPDLIGRASRQNAAIPFPSDEAMPQEMRTPSLATPPA